MRRTQVAIVGVICALISIPVVYLVFKVRGGDAGFFEVAWTAKTGHAVLRSVALALATAAICVALALPLAWLTHATDLPGRRLFRVLLNLPLAVPSYVGAFVVVALLAPGGTLHSVWSGLGLPEVYGGVGATLAMLFLYPLALLPLQASLARTDPRLWESARSLGLTPVRAFLRVIVPALRPALATGGLLVGLYAVGDFGAVSLMRFKSLSYLIYVRYKSLFDRDEAAILALVLVIVAVGLVILLRLARGRVSRALGTAGGSRPWPMVPLGRWRWPAFGFCALVALAGVGLPLFVVLGWLFRGLSLGASVEVPWTALKNSVVLGLVSATVLVLCALVPALLLRYGNRRGDGTNWLSPITSIGYALPGIVVALSIVSLAAAHLGPLYQTVTLLCAAFVIRFMPLALETISEAVGSHNRALFLAARSLGASPVRACTHVVIPNTKPALAAAFLAVFVAVIKELPLTLLLSPPGYETLATQIWMLTEDAYFAAVSPLVLSMLAIASAVLILSPRRSSL